jgi:hypothetical protein
MEAQTQLVVHFSIIPKNTLAFTTTPQYKTHDERNTVDSEPQRRDSRPPQTSTSINPSCPDTNQPHNLNNRTTPRDTQCHITRITPTTNPLRLLPLPRSRRSPPKRTLHPRPHPPPQRIPPPTSKSPPRPRTPRKKASSRSNE